MSGANATSDHSHQVLLGSAALGGPAPKDQFPDQFSRSVSPGSLLGGELNAEWVTVLATRA